MLLSEAVYSGGIMFKMTEQVEQWICIKFCIKLEHSSSETIWMIQKAAAIDTWWLSASSQLTHCCIASHAEIFGETSNHPGDSAPILPRFGTLRFLGFLKTKITKRQEVSDYQWDSGKYDRAADGNWENCVWSQGAYLEWNGGIIVLCTKFLVSCIFFNKCLYFSYYMATNWSSPHLILVQIFNCIQHIIVE